MDLRSFLRQLDASHTAYRIDRVREATMVIVSTPGERWEVEFMDDGGIEVERFRSDGAMGDGSWLDELFAADADGDNEGPRRTG